jgi:hypothetical protein
VWSTEGDSARGFDPAVRRTDMTGRWQGALPTDPAFRFDPAGAKGARPNQTFEGLSFSPDGRWLWLSMEAPLIQDGPASSVAAGGLARITRLDREGRVAAQYAYRLDPIQAAPVRRGDNGISEILAVDERRLLVLERSGVEDAQGRFAFHCRLYVVDLANAEDIAGRPSLVAAPARALAKRLLINFDRWPAASGNLEAMAWGREIAGRRTLVLFTDDNFNPAEAQRIVAISVRWAR